MRRIRPIAIYAYGSGLAASALLAIACSSPANPAGAGGACQQFSDCAPGLACVQQANGNKICSNDLTPIVHTEEAGAEAGGMPKDGGPKGDGGDSGAPPGDTGAPPGDTGSPPMDTGSPPMDTGSPPMDTGSPPMDTGTPPMDTGTPPMDSGGGTG